MAREKTPEEQTTDNERKQLAEEKKKLKKEQQAQRKEAKRRAKEIAKQEDALDDGSEGSSLLTFGATILIVILWIAVICAVIKLDIGGFGSSVVTPILKDVPVLNRILPGNSITETTDGSAYGGYTSLQDAVDQIKSLELQLEQSQTASAAKDEELDQLKAEVLRLKEFEDQQVGIRLACVGSIKDDILNMEELALWLIEHLRTNYSGLLEKRYGISEEGTAVEILGKIARARGCLKKGEELDYVKASGLLFDDFRGGKIGRVTLEWAEQEKSE